MLSKFQGGILDESKKGEEENSEESKTQEETSSKEGSEESRCQKTQNVSHGKRVQNH
jgi:hypothetical protein